MNHRSIQGRMLAVAAALAALGSGASLADDVATLTVTATVAPSCQLSAAPTLDFGVIDPLTDNDAQGLITWVCTNGYTTEIRLDGGGTGNINARAMGGAGTLPYQLFTDAARSTVFGDGTLGNVVPVTGVGYASPGSITVYGRVAQADAAVAPNGNYTDLVVATIIF